MGPLWLCGMQFGNYWNFHLSTAEFSKINVSGNWRVFFNNNNATDSQFIY
jgi:hypothetical protein